LKALMTPAVNTQRRRLLDRVAHVLACPECRTPLNPKQGESNLVCPQCGSHFTLDSDQFTFWHLPGEAIEQDWLNRAKELGKQRLGGLYPSLCRLIAPVYAVDGMTPFLRTFDTESELVADLGCGTMVLQDNVVCVDGTGYQNVHVVANLERLPFQDESLAGLLNLAVLEHARRPEAQVAEMRRVLKPGGRALCFVPFIQGFHASPYDYQRYTKSGLAELFREFEILDLRVGSGPTSSLLWIAQEWLAMVLSRGSVRLYRVLLPLTWILSPLKYLDVLLMRHPAATAIASAHFIEVRKPVPDGLQKERETGPAIGT
jgi:SAM-dependent methyltransferase